MDKNNFSLKTKTIKRRGKTKF